MPDIANIFGRQEFLVRRVHSLLGLLPIGGFLVVHLMTNASITDGAQTYQDRVNQIHSLGTTTLFFVEWMFILAPILAHGLIGLVIVARGHRNLRNYPYRENFRYTLQRWTGVIAFAFILWHVFHTRGWLPTEWWRTHVTQQLGGGTFDVTKAAETTVKAIQTSVIIQIVYFIGITTSIYHLANGLWTMGITWGVWTTPRSQRWANLPCLAVGILLAAVGFSALVGAYLLPLPIR
jgi:succinate dehydrogenase / fumarate reductase, cytochrome b subunit